MTSDTVLSRLRRMALVGLGLIFASTASATDYHIGPGQAYTSIGAVPWYNLQPGDTVYIHYRATPYKEKFLISSRGTPAQWIRVLGVPGPAGELPVISGDGATTSTNMHYKWQDPTVIQWTGVIQVAVDADETPLPGYIEIANLQVQDGYSDYQFTAENGQTLFYEGFAACIYARSVQHLLVHDNVMTNCGQGFYNWTGDGSSGGTFWWDGITADITLRGNHFYNNGSVNDYSMHQSYTESDGITIEYNRYGPPRVGMVGSQLKDRSAGTVIRYNYIEQSPEGWDLDLVEPEESFAIVSPKATFKQTWVYGNIIINKGISYNPAMIHWNEDHGFGDKGRATFAGAKLFFYDNTVLTVANESDMAFGFSVFNTTWGAFDCPTGPAPPGVIDVRNNIFAVLPRTGGSPIPQQKFGYCSTQNFDFGKNWVSPGWATGVTGTVTGTANIFTPASLALNVPGFVNVATNDLHLLAGSSTTGIALALPAVITTTANSLGVAVPPSLQYVYHQQVAARPSSGGAGSDVGAFDASPVSGVPVISSPSSAAVSATSATLGGNVTSDGGSAITERGVVYSTTAANANPLIGGSGVTKATAAGTTGVFTQGISGLSASTAYSFKAYATNGVGTTYTTPVSTFTTLAPITSPLISSPTSSAITTTAATLGGNVTSDGGSAITERGVVYSTTAANANPLIGGSGVTKTIAAGTTGIFTAGVAGLVANTGYSFKAYATNGVGTTYTTPVSTFTTLASATGPTISTPTSAAITATTATLGGNVTSDGGSGVTERGVVYSTTAANANPLIGGSGVTKTIAAGTTGVFTAAISGLSASTGYSFKAYATNGIGTTYTAPTSTFTTTPTPTPGSVATTARALVVNSASQSALSVLVPDIWYRARLFANRSYQISAWPVGHEQGVDAAGLSVTVFSDDAGTVPAGGVSGGSGVLEASPNAEGDSKPFTAIIQPTATGRYKIRVHQLSGGTVSHTVNLILRETTLFSPWTSRAAGFEGFIELHNNTTAAVPVTLRAFDSVGALQGAGLTLTLPPNATDFRTATQIGVPVNVFAGIALTHAGAFGAVTGNITTLNGANGLSFDSPFVLRDTSVQARPAR